MPRTITDCRTRPTSVSSTVPASAQSLLLCHAETRIKELQTENARLLSDLQTLRRIQTPSPLALLTNAQTVCLALFSVGVSLLFLFFVLVHR